MSLVVLVSTFSHTPFPAGEAEAGYITRISRSCINDANFDTYSEVTLECHIGGENFNLLQAAATIPASSQYAEDLDIAEGSPVLLGVFAPGDGMSLEPRHTSALCTYSLPYIDRLFDQNIHMCFNGSMKDRNLPYISGPVDNGKCPSAGSSGNIASFCEAALKISGPSPIVQEVGLSLGNHLGSSVTGTTVGTNMVAMVGTSQGKIVKVLLDGRPAIVETFRAAPEGEPILPGTVMHENNVEILVLTPRRLRKVKAADCNKIGFCGECLSRRDPFCGWCSLQNECSLQSECR